jgi:hypothetical protein
MPGMQTQKDGAKENHQRLERREQRIVSYCYKY